MGKTVLKTTLETTESVTIARQPFVVGNTAHIKLLAQIVHQNDLSEKGVDNCFGINNEDLIALAELLFPDHNFWHTEFNVSGSFWRMARVAIRIQYPAIFDYPIASWVGVSTNDDFKQALDDLMGRLDGKEYVLLTPDRSDDVFGQNVFFQFSVANVHIRCLGGLYVCYHPCDLRDLAVLLCQTSSPDSSRYVFLRRLLHLSVGEFGSQTLLMNTWGVRLHGFVLPSE